MAELTKEELDERVSLLRHFRSLLEQQRAKFQEYLAVLEKQQDSISSENAEAIIAHTELEQQVVKNIANLQKVIVPMSKMYSSTANKIGIDSKDEDDIKIIQRDLDSLQTKVLKQNEKNRELLRVHITELRTKINNFQNPYNRMPQNVYGQKVAVGSMVEINA